MIDWEKIGDFARPFSIYVCAFAIAVCCFIPLTANLALPLAAALAGGTGFMRTMDKKTLAAAATVDKQTDASVAVATQKGN